MRILNQDTKTNSILIQTDTLDDLWHLEQLILEGDKVESHTFRTYKVGDREEKKPVTILLEALKIEYSKSANRLRVLGKIVSGFPEEFVQLGKHHTIEIGINDKIQIIKEWKKHEIDRIKKAIDETKKAKIRIIVLDEEKALICSLRAFGIEYGAEIQSSLSKRDENYNSRAQEYFGKIISEIERHDEKYIIAGPGFTKDNLKVAITKKNPNLLKQIIFESVSYAERSGVNELFKNGVIEKIAGEERLQQEIKIMDSLLLNIYKETGLSCYGINETKKAAELFAIDKLIVLDEYLRTDQICKEVVSIADKNKADIIVFSSQSDSGEKLRGFGKIAAILKFKIRDV